MRRATLGIRVRTLWQGSNKKENFECHANNKTPISMSRYYNALPFLETWRKIHGAFGADDSPALGVTKGHGVCRYEVGVCGDREEMGEEGERV
jgi:hypothetical protein